MPAFFFLTRPVDGMARIARLRVYPVKGLDGIDRESGRIDEWGTLDLDRRYVLLDEAGDPINGKRTATIHSIDASFDPEDHRLTVETPAEGPETVTLADAAGRERAGEYFEAVFDRPVRVEPAEPPAVDRPGMGPAVISTATLETIADWFDLGVENVRRRLRANVEIAGVPAFWEDRFVGPDAPSFTIDGVRLDGVTPCGRCVVPTRDPDTGAPIDDFQERFVERREATFPEWADERAFDHSYTAMILTEIPAADRSASIAVGDPVAIT